MDESQGEIRELTRLLRELLERVSRLEEAVGISDGARHGAVLPQDRQVRSWDTRSPTRRPQRAGRGDLEARIGSQWLSRVGIAAVLVGVSYFLKYAFESNWIGRAGQVVIGLVAGLAVVVWSEWFRRRGYLAFSYSLKAVGIGALYLSIWAAFQAYGLVPRSVAFTAMVLVTGATAGLAMLQEAEILAAFALAGGFLTPML